MSSTPAPHGSRATAAGRRCSGCPIEPISQASAAQRAGRSGRVAPGVCIRLYSEEDFASRPRFTDPEILRTNLAAVILQMAALQLGDIEDFPFLDPPDERSIRDGVLLLQELGAFDRDGAITELGRRLARLPVDPRIGRMILQADAEGCVREVLVLAAALSIPDPRERPADREEAARQKHARFADEQLGLHLVPEPVALPARATKRAFRQRVSAHVPRGVPALPAHPRVAGPHRPAAQHRPRHRHP